MNRWYEFLNVETGSEPGTLLNGRLCRETINRKKVGFGPLYICIIDCLTWGLGY